MTFRLPPLQALRAFEAAARHLSFKRAAAELHVTPAAVSQQVRQLEAWLGQTLFRRLTRAVVLSPVGEALLPAIQQGFATLAGALAECRRSDPVAAGSVLTIQAPPTFASRWLVGRLPQFAAQYPAVEIRLASTDDSVDQLGADVRLDPAAHDPLQGGELLAIRYGRGNYPGWQAERILTPAYIPVCRPDLPGLMSPLSSAEDIRQFTLIHDATLRNSSLLPGWAQWLQLAGVNGKPVRRGLHFSNTVLAIEAALAGQGVALVPSVLVEAEIAAQRLCQIFPLSLVSPYAYWLLLPRRAELPAALRAFRDWVLATGLQS